MGTATYGKIWYDEDVHDLRSVETEFPAIVFDDTFTSELTHSCKPMVSPPNDNKIDFRISFDESNDEDYTILRMKNFSPLFYNDALTSKLDFLTEPTVSPQHIDEFDLKDEASLSECDEEEQNILYFNDLFSFNIIYPDDSKSDKDNDDDKIDIKQSPGVITEYLVNINKRRAFWSLNEDILKIYYSKDQYAVSIKEDTTYPCLHSPKTTKD
ncbi:hypothetical protein Tco_0975908 [Tanacetum coccineum]|uniref:Uncharacterized protein n=1 Tax=Tanacetum coccineum TaxID=301880 RepID=A0ABQ5EFX9_9ASTR